jgi:hypothetical protein
MVRCSKCRGICRLESYDPELSTKQNLIGTCNSLLKAIDDAIVLKASLSAEEALLLETTQNKLSQFLKRF